MAKLIEGEDYTLDPHTGHMILTAKFLLERGYCCRNGCRNCPYEPKHKGPAQSASAQASSKRTKTP